MAELKQLWVDIGRQGAEKLYNKAVKSGLAVTRKQVQEFVKSQASAQVFQPRAKSDGKVVATAPLKSWQVDVMDMKQFAEKANKGFKFVLVAIDVFDRTMKAAPMKTKSPEETARVFRTFAPLPAEVDTDHGQEFGGGFQKLLDDKGIGHREKDPKAINSLAVSDRAIGTLRASIAKDMTARGTSSWHAGLKGAVSAYNNTGHAHLLGSEPSDVAKIKELTYELKVQAGEDIKHNAELHGDKMEALRKAGGFRTMLPRNTWARAHQPSWGDKIHKVDKFVGPDVVDTEGNRFAVKLVLPVAATTIAAKVPKELTGGRPARTGASIQTMQAFAFKLRDILREETRTLSSSRGGPSGLAMQVAGRRMNEVDGFKEAMQEAKLVGIGSFRRFVVLFPRLFKVEGNVPRQRVALNI